MSDIVELDAGDPQLPRSAGYLTTRHPQQQLMQSPPAGVADDPRRAEIRQPPRGDVVKGHRPMVRRAESASLLGMTLLRPGDPFPALTLATANGELSVPQALAGDFGVVLFNRGAWCSYCTAQLRSFQRAQPRLAEVGARIIALWVEDEATTKGFAEDNSIEFPIGYGVDADAVAAATGAFVNTDPAYLQSTGFVLNTDGKVLVSVYSSGTIGRLVPDEVIGMIQWLTAPR
jgi:peroxiredoxin